MKNLIRYRHCSSCLFGIYLLIIITSMCSSIEHSKGFDSLLLLPHSRSKETEPRTKRVLFVGDFGAKGDGIHDDTQALKHVWDVACLSPKSMIIVFPAKSNFLIHPIDIAGPCRSKVTLRISGTIHAPEDPYAWTGLNPRKWLYFHGINHLTVEGGGTINGMGHEWWARSCKINSSHPCHHAPTAITFHRCKRLTVRDLLVIDSQQMHVAFTNCLRVVASRLKVIAPAFSPNTDGIHISSSNGVRVNNSIISTGDDCISIVGNTSRVQIRNIACGPGHGISIGSLGKLNTCSQVNNITVDGAILSGTQNGVRIKTWQGGSGFATDITFSNVLMKNVSNPVIVDQFYCDSKLPCENQDLACLLRIQTSAVKVGNISFVHIKGTSATDEAIRFACSDSFLCEGLYLEDMELVSSSGEISRSFCWEAYGSSTDPVYPPPCFLDSRSLIKLKTLPDSIQLSI